MNSQQSKTYGNSKGSPEREFHNDTGLPKTDRNISNKQPNPTSARAWETRTNSPEQIEGRK